MTISKRLKYFGAFVAPPLIVAATTAVAYKSGSIASGFPYLQPIVFAALALGLVFFLTLEFENLLARVLGGLLYVIPCLFMLYVASFLTGCVFGDCL